MLTQLHFCSIGFGHSVCANKVYMLISPKPKYSQRLVKQAKREDRWIDATCRRPTKSLIMMDDGRVISCAFSPQTMLARLQRACDDFVTDVPPVEDEDDEEFDAEFEQEEDTEEEDSE